MIVCGFCKETTPFFFCLSDFSLFESELVKPLNTTEGGEKWEKELEGNSRVFGTSNWLYSQIVLHQSTMAVDKFFSLGC